MQTIGAWSTEQRFEFDVMLGPGKGLKTCHGMRRQLTEGEERAVAKAIREQLDLSGWGMKPARA